MVQCHFQVKLPRYPDRRKNIVHPVYMSFQGNLPVKHRKPAFHPEILLEVLALVCSSFLLPGIADRLRQFLPQHGRDGHPGGRAFILSGIVYFRILAEGNLHCCRRFDYNIVYPPSPGFQKRKLAPCHIGTAGTDHGGRNARPNRIVEGCIHGIDGIHCPQVRRERFYRLVAVVPFHALFLFRDSHMAMGLYNARHNQPLPNLYHTFVRRGMKCRFTPPSDFRYFPVGDADTAVLNVFTCHCFDTSADYIHAVPLPFSPSKPVIFRRSFRIL